MLPRTPSHSSCLSRALEWGFLCLLLLALPRPALAQVREAPEFQIKATWLVNFGRFIEWPEEDPSAEGAAFTIGVLGDDPFGEAFAAYEGEPVRGNPVEIRRFRRLEDLEWTHILYVSESENDRLDEILQLVGRNPTLTVGDARDFTSKGGIIRFVRQGTQLRFEVNRGAADLAGLQISSHLLRVATGTLDSPEERRR